MCSTPVTCGSECRQEALNTVKVPIEVRQLLADLRTHLREKLEPPVYVSDRRLVKAIGLMQVNTLNAVAGGCSPQNGIGLCTVQLFVCAFPGLVSW